MPRFGKKSVSKSRSIEQLEATIRSGMSGGRGKSLARPVIGVTPLYIDPKGNVKDRPPASLWPRNQKVYTFAPTTKSSSKSTSSRSSGRKKSRSIETEAVPLSSPRPIVRSGPLPFEVVSLSSSATSSRSPSPYRSGRSKSRSQRSSRPTSIEKDVVISDEPSSSDSEQLSRKPHDHCDRSVYDAVSSDDEIASRVSHGGSAALLHARQRYKRHNPSARMVPLDERPEISGRGFLPHRGASPPIAPPAPFAPTRRSHAVPAPRSTRKNTPSGHTFDEFIHGVSAMTVDDYDDDNDDYPPPRHSSRTSRHSSRYDRAERASCTSTDGYGIADDRSSYTRSRARDTTSYPRYSYT